MSTTSLSTVAGRTDAPVTSDSLNLVPSGLVIRENLIFLIIEILKLDVDPLDVMLLPSALPSRKPFALPKPLPTRRSPPDLRVTWGNQ